MDLIELEAGEALPDRIHDVMAGKAPGVWSRGGLPKDLGGDHDLLPRKPETAEGASEKDFGLTVRVDRPYRKN